MYKGVNMFFYLNQLFLFILLFISFHFTYNYIKTIFSTKQKETEVIESTKYNNILNEIDTLLDTNSIDDFKETENQSFHNPYLKEDLSINIQPSIIQHPNLEEELIHYMREVESELLHSNTTLPTIIEDETEEIPTSSSIGGEAPSETPFASYF